MKKLCLSLLVIFFVFVVYAATFSDTSQSDFSGVFNNTFYNSSGFIQLNNTINGTTTSNTTNISEMIGNETGLISYWRFNESSWIGAVGEVKDVLGKSNGTVPNTTTANTTLGKFGNAGNFSGASGTYTNEVQIANREELNPRTGSFTITGWAKSITRGGNGYQLYVSKRDNVAAGRNGYYIGILEGSGIKFVVGDGTDRVDTSYVNIDYTNWFHFAAVINRSSNQSLLYINGSLGTSANIAGVDSINNSWNLSIGNDEGQALLGATWQYPVKGQIDEVAFWNYALSASEISALHQKGIANTTNSTTNSTEIYSGTYESGVKDGGSIVGWQNISWAEEFPYNEEIASTNTNFVGLVGLWHLNEASGTIVDYSGLGNNGTQSGGVTYSSSGKFNTSLSFDGNNDYINLGNANSLNINKNITLSAWVNFNQIPSGATVYAIVDKNEAGGYGIIANEATSGKLETYFYIGSYRLAGVALSSLSAGNWYHVVGTYNGTSVDFYLNGVRQQSVAATGMISNISYSLTIGANPGPSYAEFFNGKIDEVTIWNRSLSESEILDLYKRGAMDLKFQVRTSNDNSTWSDYKGTDGTSGTYYTQPGQALDLNSRYLQYKSYLDRNLTSDNIKLYNVSLTYDNSGASNISVSLDSPTNNYLTNQYNGINITCSASSGSELVNVTPYYSKFGWSEVEPARSISGTSNTTIFTLNEITSTILWNCYFCNVDGECSFADSNWTIIGDILAPIMNLVSPTDNYFENSTQTINFIFNSTDNRATFLDCRLLIDNSEVASNSSVLTGINTTLSTTLANGNHSWRINCSDGLNSALSSERQVNVSYLAVYIPFWAKTNTHTHTTNSDGSNSPASVVDLYKNLGYTILAITDHGFVTDCTPFTNLSAPFLCVNSEEWTSTKHVVRVNVSSPYNNAAANMQNATNAANDNGGFAIVAHPNWSSTIWTLSDLTSLQNYTAMEIYNKVIERLTPDPYAVLKWDEVLKTGKKIFGVAADDMHQVSVDLGYGFTKVYMSEFTKQAYVNSMKTGYFYSSQGPNMDSGPFTLICDGTDSYHMGQTANCSAISISATISATNSSLQINNISLIKDGNYINNKTDCSATQNCSYSYSENVSISGYYRLQATDSSNKRIWSNPIWVNKIALPVAIIVNSPENNSQVLDYTPLLNVSLNQQTTLWYNLNGNSNKTLCTGCSYYTGYITLKEGDNNLSVYANNSDNIIKINTINVSLDFNKSSSDSFEDNSSINSFENVVLSDGSIDLEIGKMFGNFILQPIQTINNITSFTIEWAENNTANAKGDGQRFPIILKYKINESSGWIYTGGSGDYIINGTTVSGLMGNNLSLMFDFEKNNQTPINLLDFRITWTEFTVPLISNVGKSLITSSSAVISWNTDLPSNSSIQYGITSSLGQSVLINDSVTNHSITLTGLLPAQGYSFRVLSCTESSCAQYPQEPYTPDSFTTQSESSSTGVGGGGGSSSGGGGGGNVTQKTIRLEVNGISSFVANPGDTKKISWIVKNSGTNFLNNCRFKSSGEFASWIDFTQTKNLAAGEEYTFIFDLDIPDDAKFGKHSLEVLLECKETSKSSPFTVDVLEKKFGFKLIDVSRESDDQVKITYSLEEMFGLDQEIKLQFLFYDSDNKKISEIDEKRLVPANSLQQFETFVEVDPSLEGDVGLLVNLNSDIYSTFVKENIVVGAPISGFTIFGGEGSFGNIATVVIVVLFLVFALFMIRQIRKHHKQIRFRKSVKVYKHHRR